MGALIPEEIVETVRAHTDIVQLVSEYVHLERKGKNYSGICPFHEDKDPSFTVSPGKQIFHCFGCGVGGNVFKFLMLAENLTFPEAVRRLAARCGVAVPERVVDSPAARRRERAWELNAAARDFYRHQLLHLPEAAAARDYLARRGVSAEIQEAFQLGYAPSGWRALTNFLTARNFKERELQDLDLAAVGAKGLHDRFRGRIIFPIFDFHGRVIGFGGRALGDGTPRYLNTSETTVFNKGHVLFGLHLARAAIREKGFAVIMEGYMDVIAAHQFGVNNAVASLGTSLTAEQIKLLTRYTRDVVIAYDADAAGVAATLRGMELLQQAGCRVKVVTVPAGKDPDEFLHRYGADGWRELLARAQTLLDYKLHRVLEKGGDTAALLQEVLPLLARTGEVEREEGVRRVAARLNLSLETVKEVLRRYIEEQGKKWSNPDKIAKNKHNIIKSELRSDAVSRAEEALVQLMVGQPALVDRVRREMGDWEPANGLLRTVYRELCRAGGVVTPAALLDRLDEAAQQSLTRLLVANIPGVEQPALVLPDLLATLKRKSRQEEKNRLMERLAEAERMNDQEQVIRILEELKSILAADAGKPRERGGKTI